MENLTNTFRDYFEKDLADIIVHDDIRAYMEGAAPRLLVEEARLAPLSDTILKPLVSKPVDIHFWRVTDPS